MNMTIQGETPHPAPIAHSIPQSVRISGVGRSTIYKAIKSGELETLKIGARRLVPDESLRAWLSSHKAG